MTTKSNNPFLLRPEDAGPDSNLSDLQDTGAEMTSPLVSYTPQHNSLEELASQDTTHINALRTRADNVMNKTEKFVIPEAEGVRDLCNVVDAAMADDDTLDEFDLGKIRNYVKALMITLKAKPEFAGILLDTDVTNIVRFARHMYAQAIQDQSYLAEKKATSAKKRASTSQSKKKKGGAFASLDFGALDI